MAKDAKNTALFLEAIRVRIKNRLVFKVVAGLGGVQDFDPQVLVGGLAQGFLGGAASWLSVCWSAAVGAVAAGAVAGEAGTFAGGVVVSVTPSPFGNLSAFSRDSISSGNNACKLKPDDSR